MLFALFLCMLILSFLIFLQLCVEKHTLSTQLSYSLLKSRHVLLLVSDVCTMMIEECGMTCKTTPDPLEKQSLLKQSVS